MKLYRLISIAVMAIVMVACDDINEVPQDPQEQVSGKIHFTATINTQDPSTRALSFEAGVLNANWKVGEEIALIYGSNPKVKDKARVTSVSNGKATVECDLSGTPQSGDIISFYYPYASVIEKNGSYVFDETLIYNQDGTMDYISEKLDWRQATGSLSINGNKATLQDDVDMSKSEVAIWKLSLENLQNTLNAKSFSVYVGFGLTANITKAGSTYYVALLPFSNKVVELWAGTNENPNAYLFEKEGVTLAANTFYESTVQLGKVINFNKLLADYTMQDTEILWCAAGETQEAFIKVSIADGATISLKNVLVEGPDDNNHKWAGLTCLGNATIFILSGQSNVIGYNNHYPGIFIPEGYTLTIKGMKEHSSLTCQSNGNAPGIGSVRGYVSTTDSNDNTPYISSGNIIIKSGHIIAIGGNGCPGIGNTVKTSCGNITIENGVVEASTILKSGGAGIGGCYGQGKCGNITILGGTVTAIGSEEGPGIGAGCHDTFQSEEDKYNICGNITISGGQVTATGGDYGAGIGCGKMYSKCGDITIGSDVLKVTAIKGQYALNSIGKADNDNVCGTITKAPGAPVIEQ